METVEGLHGTRGIVVIPRAWVGNGQCRRLRTRGTLSKQPGVVVEGKHHHGMTMTFGVAHKKKYKEHALQGGCFKLTYWAFEYSSNKGP